MNPLSRLLPLLLLASASQLLAEVPQNAEDASPLEKGAQVPAVSVKTLDGESVALNDLVSEQPTVLIFYRGGWCPFCTKHLAAVQKVATEVDAMGFQIVGVSPDRPAKNKDAAEKHALKYQLLSDSSAEAMKAFGVAFQVPESLVSKYKNEYGIDIEGDSGETHHILPVPALYLVGTDGTIRFAHFDPNYRERLEVNQILNELKRAKAYENI
ncbi:MAG: peroxiredoxin-like family protein [Verrucomicrobiota bacterium]